MLFVLDVDFLALERPVRPSDDISPYELPSRSDALSNIAVNSVLLGPAIMPSAFRKDFERCAMLSNAYCSFEPIRSLPPINGQYIDKVGGDVENRVCLSLVEPGQWPARTIVRAQTLAQAIFLYIIDDFV